MAVPSGTARGTAFDGGSLVELLRFRARVQPDDRAFVFLRDGEHESDAASYAELDRRSRTIAAALQTRAAPGARALLMYPPGLDFVSAFFGCLYAGVVAVPVLPPRWRAPDRNLGRAVSVAEDAQPEVVLTTTGTAERWARAAAAEAEAAPGLTRFFGRRPAGDDADAWLATDTLDARDRPEWRNPGPDPRTLALLQYTSGSTDAPRGVMISHGNLLHNLSYAFHRAGNDRASVSVSWLPVVHDMGLIDGVLQPVYSGCPACLMSPAAFLQRPIRWLRAISRYRATRSGAPNFAYDLCVRRIGVDERAALDLRSWRDAYNGAEPIRRSTLERFAAAFADSGFRPTAFRPSYGLAEATLLVTSGRYEAGASPSRPATPRRSTSRTGSPELPPHSHVVPSGVAEPDADASSGGESGVSCGRPGFATSVVVVDPGSRRPCAGGAVGEIWVRGPGVAAGYWNRPALTARTFGARTAGGDGPYLRTGDLGVVDDHGVRITGRSKDVLIVRGAKHYPQDLERTAEGRHRAVRPGCAAAFAADRGSSGDRIALVAEVDPHRLESLADADAAIAAIRSGVTEAHGVQLSMVTLVPPGGVEKTTSGKVKRFACRNALLAGTLEALAMWRRPSPRDMGTAPAPGPGPGPGPGPATAFTGSGAREPACP